MDFPNNKYSAAAKGNVRIIGEWNGGQPFPNITNITTGNFGDYDLVEISDLPGLSNGPIADASAIGVDSNGILTILYYLGSG